MLNVKHFNVGCRAADKGNLIFMIVLPGRPARDLPADRSGPARKTRRLADWKDKDFPEGCFTRLHIKFSFASLLNFHQHEVSSA